MVNPQRAWANKQYEIHYNILEKMVNPQLRG